MARYISYDPHQTELIPVALAEQLAPGTLEHTIHYVVTERLDLKFFDQAYNNDKEGRPAYDPRILLKVILLGYSRGLLSSRKIERACRENITFMALACGQHPDHSTLAQFISSMEKVEELFTKVLLICEEEGLLGGTHFSIDGYKLSSNASKEWSGTHKDLRKKKEKLQELSRKALETHKHNDQSGGESSSKSPTPSGEKLARQADKIERFLQEEEPRQGRSGREVQSNVTDNQSAKMKSGQGIIQGYNANALVDDANQVVVHAQAFGEGNDSATAGPMLQGAATKLAATGPEGKSLAGAIVTADTSYFTHRNLEACENAQVDAYIPDPHFRRRDPRFAEAQRHRRPTDRRKQQYKSKRKTFSLKDFKVDPTTGRLICPAGVLMYRNGHNNLNAQGYYTTTYRAAKGACQRCDLRAKCLQNPDQSTPRQVRIFHGQVKDDLITRMKQKIDTPVGRHLYSQRLGNVEPVFANIAAQKGMDRSTLRGSNKVNIQWKLYCLVHNLGKLARKAQNQN